jgi:hypothetical protein
MGQKNLNSQEVIKKKRKSTWLPKVGYYVVMNQPPELVFSKLEPFSDGRFKVLEVYIQAQQLQSRIGK